MGLTRIRSSPARWWISASEKTGVRSANWACSVEPSIAVTEVRPEVTSARHVVEIARPDERLVLDGPIAVVALQLELALLELRVGEHSLVAVGVGQLEHAHVQDVEAGQGDNWNL